MKSLLIWLLSLTQWGTFLIIGNGERVFAMLLGLLIIITWSVPLGLLWWLVGGAAAVGYAAGTAAVGVIALVANR